LLSNATRDGRAIGSCSKCGAGIAFEGVSEGSRVTCHNCGESVKLSYVLGNKSGYICDALCMGAVGKYCSCSCGGQNHGRYYLPIEFVPVWDRDKAKAAQTKRIATFKVRQEKRVADESVKAEAGRVDLLAANPILAEMLDDATWQVIDNGSTFMYDMRSALQSGRMSERMVNATVTAINRVHKQLEREQRWQVEREEVLASGVQIEDGRYAIEGTIITVREELDPYSYVESYVYKILVKQDNGLKVWGSLPNSLRDGGNVDGRWDHENFKGRRITFTAAFTQSNDDKTFGFYKRPTKAKYVV
jgi:hypothetical protein